MQMMIRGEVVEVMEVVYLVPRIWARSPIMPASSMTIVGDATEVRADLKGIL